MTKFITMAATSPLGVASCTTDSGEAVAPGVSATAVGTEPPERSTITRSACSYALMKKPLAAVAAALMFTSIPAVASAQSSGSLGSLGGDLAPVTPVEHAPNPLEVETIAEMNEVIAEIIARQSDAGDILIILERDSELSRMAQYGASKLVDQFAAYETTEFDDEGDEDPPRFRANVLVPDAPYRQTFVCGPAPLTVEQIGAAYRQSHYSDSGLDGLRYDIFSLISFENPVIGVGYAEQEGFACSYAMQQSANYPFY